MTTDPVAEAREALLRAPSDAFEWECRFCSGYQTHAEMCEGLRWLHAFEQAVRADALRIPEDSEFAGATPGPWRWLPDADSEWGDLHGLTATVLTADAGYWPEDADARLIAAAPDLLARVRALEASNVGSVSGATGQAPSGGGVLERGMSRGAI